MVLSHDLFGWFEAWVDVGRLSSGLLFGLSFNFCPASSILASIDGQ
jgi:hypothetical protein